MKPSIECMSEIWNEGWKAFLNSTDICPYPEGSDERREWVDGYATCMAESENE